MPEEIGRARRWVREILGERPCAEDAALIVSELGTNALRHTASGRPCGTFHVVMALSSHVLAISVTDDGQADTTPEIKRPDPEATQGRGLGMISALTVHIDVRSGPQGQTVTAELTMEPKPTRDGVACC
ncbi:ATP-binding protein [Streptacidiphilus sp. N1-3]|uniref:ATP-binding protein n=1 Tax=Streptacidiphilus alkalitolerans TaxID=3342712 RepID=A0ABV6X756_9ACTN